MRRHDGHQIWAIRSILACSNYPECQNTRNLAKNKKRRRIGK